MPWYFLLPPVAGLIWLCWPYGAWHQASWMFIGLFIGVLGYEAWSAWFSPDKKTVSNVIRDGKKKYGEWRFWLGGTCWMLFAWLLWVHFAT